jgi:hypothetical protein
MPDPIMHDPLPAVPIAALPAQDKEKVQSLMRLFALELAQAGVKVAGVTQMRGDDPSGRPRIFLRDLASEAEYVISQDLGPGSVACNLDAGELAMACAAVEQAARDGVQLIVVSKFAKQEAARGGLCDAFRAAMNARIPVIAAVSPYFREEWRLFAGPLAEDVEPTPEALADWWARAQRSA